MSTFLQVRMYNVGFGDCFLIRTPDGRTILVDAGFHSQGKGAFSGNELAQRVVEDVRDDNGSARIDVVIATHRHQDHIFAFNSDIWDEVDVGEVWMPWVEDRKNSAAASLWRKQRQFALDLAASVPSFNLDDGDRESVEFMLWNAGVDMPGVHGAEGGWSNQNALDRLHEGFAKRDRARPRFLPSAKAFPQTFESTALPGVRAHVLGPPRDPSLIQELDPSTDGESYRAIALRAASMMPSSAGAAAPFGLAWQVAERESGFFLESRTVKSLDSLATSADAVAAAASIDNMINSTSLVLVLDIGKARLLLPGDAEWGTWKRILAHDDARALLRGATFIKVGHHGSHNATPKTLVEKILKRNIPAMVSTQAGKGNYRNNIPLTALMDAFDGRGIDVVRSDGKASKLPQGFSREADGKWIDVELPC
ncbi:ComEC/Rec2 family competence protein [Dokdonella ginsengisoli]|uniref:ComEC/Rec2 family competence protein n=1 Tax=Dokdonella ginsengisoli TaxID=363846 RepID=A0ABV9QXA2_9GAMM